MADTSNNFNKKSDIHPFWLQFNKKFVDLNNSATNRTCNSLIMDTKYWQLKIEAEVAENKNARNKFHFITNPHTYNTSSLDFLPICVRDNIPMLVLDELKCLTMKYSAIAALILESNPTIKILHSFYDADHLSHGHNQNNNNLQNGNAEDDVYSIVDAIEIVSDIDYSESTSSIIDLEVDDNTTVFCFLFLFFLSCVLCMYGVICSYLYEYLWYN